MSKIVVSFDVSQVVQSKKTGKDGTEYVFDGINVGKKFFQIRCGKGKQLPPAGLVVCNMYARPYKTSRGEFEEIALFCDNAIDVPSEEPQTVTEEVAEMLSPEETK